MKVFILLILSFITRPSLACDLHIQSLESILKSSPFETKKVFAFQNLSKKNQKELKKLLEKTLLSDNLSPYKWNKFFQKFYEIHYSSDYSILKFLKGKHKENIEEIFQQRAEIAFLELKLSDYFGIKKKNSFYEELKSIVKQDEIRVITSTLINGAFIMKGLVPLHLPTLQYNMSQEILKELLSSSEYEMFLTSLKSVEIPKGEKLYYYNSTKNLVFTLIGLGMIYYIYDSFDEAWEIDMKGKIQESIRFFIGKIEHNKDEYNKSIEGRNWELPMKIIIFKDVLKDEKEGHVNHDLLNDIKMKLKISDEELRQYLTDEEQKKLVSQ